MDDVHTYAAFAGDRRIAAGDLAALITQLKQRSDRGSRDEAAAVLIFEDHTGRQIELDLRGALDEVLRRELPAPAPSGPGRPKLGVVSREVTLLPRHWAWLEEQPSGISAALRRLVDEARKRVPDKQRARRARDAACRFMTAMAGNRPGYEEASRALYAQDEAALTRLTRRWPKDVRAQLMHMLGKEEA
jgi:hypothetical protein